MGVLSDIIIASPDEAASINAAGGNHLKRWACLESKGIDTIKLSTLWQILNNQPLDGIDAGAQFMMDGLLDQRSDEGPWLYLLPDALVAAVAALDEDAEESVSEKWAETEEFQLDGW